MNEFLTWEFLTTFTGMVAFVTAVTQLVKFYVNLDPKWIALVAAIVGQFSVQLAFVKDFSMEGIIMTVFNIVSVLLGAIGTFETVVKPIQRKLEKK